MRVAIVGASGYAGLELVRIVLRHPKLELVAVTSEQRAGMPVGEAFPALRSLVDLDFESANAEALAGRIDVAFTALPHGASAGLVAELYKAGVTVLDIGADFRLRSRETFQQWYGDHQAPELFGQAVYGLPEVYAAELKGARLVACPGCYPTCSLLPSLPFLREGWVARHGIQVMAMSGVSGAGRTLSDGYLFAELEGNARAYKVAAHRHMPEIEQELSLAAGEDVTISFVPHLIPASRGMLATIALPAAAGSRALDAEAAHGLLSRSYAGAPFVRVLPLGEIPAIQSVRGSNFCDVAVSPDPHNGTLLVLSAIDNLVKGAGGQGVQALNVIKGWDETTGLLEGPLLP
jgi:N-acetyl-gamma-glutamyl-phosphate reductase